MVNYGTDEKFMVKIVNIDYEPEIAGIKLSQFPAIISVSSIPLWFNILSLAVVLLFSLISFSLYASRRDLEGRPITLNDRLIKILVQIPKVIRTGLFPSISSIEPYCKSYRR